MLSCFINLNNSYKFFALVASIILPLAVVCPSTATTFAVMDIPETENLLLSPQPEEDADEEPGKTIPPN
ncbi:MAG: hypothetical protein QNJ68_15700 [Microcoleaceae cyanobacterium MO_207.B10]|nr:hypothetical protein [Microcoleaceae cyanobacterium MO_207.B10]